MTALLICCPLAFAAGAQARASTTHPDAGAPPTVVVSSHGGGAAASTAGTAIEPTGEETLADAITYLNGHGGGTITFAAGFSGRITLTVHLPEIRRPTRIVGPGWSKLTLSDPISAGTNQLATVPELHSLTGLSLSGMTLFDGGGDPIFASSGSLSVTGVVQTGSGAVDAVVHIGSGATTVSDDRLQAQLLMQSRGAVDINDTEISGVAFQTAVVLNGQPTTVLDTTISGSGGGISDRARLGHAPLTTVNSTIADNATTVSHGGEAITIGRGIELLAVGDTIDGNSAQMCVNNGCNPADDASVVGSDDRMVLEDTVLAGEHAHHPADIRDRGGVVVVRDSFIGNGDPATVEGRLELDGQDQVGTRAHPIKPELGPLRSAGDQVLSLNAPPATMRPNADSPLIGHGDAGEFTIAGAPLLHYEGGARRPRSGGEIGAFQR